MIRVRKIIQRNVYVFYLRFNVLIRFCKILKYILFLKHNFTEFETTKIKVLDCSVSSIRNVRFRNVTQRKLTKCEKSKDGIPDQTAMFKTVIRVMRTPKNQTVKRKTMDFIITENTNTVSLTQQILSAQLQLNQNRTYYPSTAKRLQWFFYLSHSYIYSC